MVKYHISSCFFHIYSYCFSYCAIDFTAAYLSGPSSLVSLTKMEAKFLRLTSDLKMSTNQADAVSRCIKQGRNRNVLIKHVFFMFFMNFSCFFFIFLTCCQVSDVAAQQHEGPLRGQYPRIAQHNGCAPRRGSKWAIHGPPDNPSCRSRVYGKFLIKHQLFLINTCSTGRFMERLCHDSAC